MKWLHKMVDHELQFLDVANGNIARRIAVRVLEPKTEGAPTIVWLIGLKSDMGSTKAAALATWCTANGYGLTRFDYTGHGQSSGDFGEATTSDWLQEAEAVIRQKTGDAPLILVGSSTGAHIALVVLRRLMESDVRLAGRILGLVLIAPAWDVTELIWDRLPAEARQEILETGSHDQPSGYDEPYHITKKFIDDGRANLLVDAPFDPQRPVMVLQGLLDDSVPPEHARALSKVLHGDWVKITEVTDAGHSLSRPEDLEKIYSLIKEVAASSRSA